MTDEVKDKNKNLVLIIIPLQDKMMIDRYEIPQAKCVKRQMKTLEPGGFTSG